MVFNALFFFHFYSPRTITMVNYQRLTRVQLRNQSIKRVRLSKLTLFPSRFAIVSMMQRIATSAAWKRTYSSSAKALLAEPAAAAASSSSNELVLNLCTPHEPIHHKKVVEQVVLPGAAGEYGVTAGHAPIISQLQPGVVKVHHVGVSKLMKINITLDSPTIGS